jgi:hypothetical protein
MDATVCESAIALQLTRTARVRASLWDIFASALRSYNRTLFRHDGARGRGSSSSISGQVSGFAVYQDLSVTSGLPVIQEQAADYFLQADFSGFTARQSIRRGLLDVVND